jgi:hypothetical protein
MKAAEFEWTGYAEMSVFHGLSAGKIAGIPLPLVPVVEPLEPDVELVPEEEVEPFDPELVLVLVVDAVEAGVVRGVRPVVAFAQPSEAPTRPAVRRIERFIGLTFAPGYRGAGRAVTSPAGFS